MLFRFHIILVACGAIFSAGAAVHQVLAWHGGSAARPGARWSLLAALALAAGAAALAWYFRKLLRLGWWSRRSDDSRG